MTEPTEKIPTDDGRAEGSSRKPAAALSFKKSLKSKNARKRPAAEETTDEAGSSAVVHKSKSSKVGDGKLSFSTGAAGKKSAKQREEDESTAGWKTTFSYESTRQVQTENDSRATATLETETAFDRDSRAIREKVLKNADDALKGGTKGDEKLYKGMAGYMDHTAGFRREQTVGSEKATGAHGPLRASSHIRWSVRFDYQPDICKDYKETGYCGYGDACVFLHDRGDYKSGWQLEQEWEESERKRKERIAMGESEEEGAEDEDEEEDGVPAVCFICKGDFVEPVVTRCKHYFCEHCALKHNAKSKNCFVCEKPTNGVFNTAMNVIKRMKEEREKEKETGEEGGEGEEDRDERGGEEEGREESDEGDKEDDDEDET